MTTLFTALADRAARAPDDPALVFLHRDASPVTATVGELYARALHAGVALREDLEPGDLAVLAAPVSLELVVAYWAVLACGGVATVFAHPSPRSSGQAYWRRVHEFAAAVSAQAIVTRVADLSEATTPPAGNVPVLGTDMDGEPFDAPEQAGLTLSADTAAYIQFSSGTTRAPRGAVISHRAALHAIDNLAEGWRCTGADVNVGWLPLSHDMGLVTQVLIPLLIGAPSVMVRPSHWVRDPASLLHAVTAYGGTQTWMPNFAFAHTMKAVREEDLVGVDLSSWRLILNGGELAHPATMRRFTEEFAPYGLAPDRVAVGYGMAENVLAVSTTEPGQPPKEDWVSLPDLAAGVAAPGEPGAPSSRAIASCGVSFPGTQVRVVADDGTAAADRQVGEILVRGVNLFSGYRGQPPEAAFDDGWFRTRDLGYLLDGELYVLDRLDDMLVVGGRNIRPSDIEALAREGVGDAAALVAAFGIRDPRLGTEAPVVVCERSSDDADGARIAGDIRRAVQEALEVVLADVRFVERRWIPRTTSGKIARKAARQRYVRTYLPSPPHDAP